MNIKLKIGLRIKKIRKAKGISQMELSNLANLDRTYINSIENGRRNVSIVNIEKIAKALDMSVYDFFKVEDFK
jgi:transcriptional regulator with XRE-family HTH domain